MIDAQSAPCADNLMLPCKVMASKCNSSTEGAKFRNFCPVTCGTCPPGAKIAVAVPANVASTASATEENSTAASAPAANSTEEESTAASVAGTPVKVGEAGNATGQPPVQPPVEQPVEEPAKPATEEPAKPAVEQ